MSQNCIYIKKKKKQSINNVDSFSFVSSVFRQDTSGGKFICSVFDLYECF